MCSPGVPSLFTSRFSKLQRRTRRGQSRTIRGVRGRSIRSMGQGHRGHGVVRSLPMLRASAVRPGNMSLSLCHEVNRRVAGIIGRGPKVLCIGIVVHPGCTLGSDALLPPTKRGNMRVTPVPLVPISGYVTSADLLTRVLLRGCRCRIPFCHRVRRCHRLKVGNLARDALSN